MYCLLLLSVSQLLLPSCNASAMFSYVVTSATFVAAVLLIHLSQSFKKLFSVLSLPYKGKLARYFLATLHKVPGVMAVPRTATACLSSAFSSSLTHASIHPLLVSTHSDMYTYVCGNHVPCYLSQTHFQCPLPLPHTKPSRKPCATVTYAFTQC